MELPKPMDKSKEKDFNEWLDSIDFVDKEGQVIPPVLTNDTSSDPENDRAGTPTDEKGK